MDQIIHFLIPIAFIVVWVINSLMNKEGANAPPARMPGPRPGGPLPPAPRPVPRDPTIRFPQSDAMPPSRRPMDEEVLVIRPDDSRGGRPPARPGPVPAARRGGRRGQPAPAPAPRRPEPAPDRALGGRVSQTVSQTIDRPLDVRPLSQSESIASGSASGQVTATVGLGSVSTPSTLVIRALLASPTSIRDALILSELLQPPLALRKK